MSWISFGIMITSWSMLCDRNPSMSSADCWDGTTPSLSACTSSTGERHFHINGSGAIYWDMAAITAAQIGAPASGQILQ